MKYFYWNGSGRCSSDTYVCTSIQHALFVNTDALQGAYKIVNGERVACLDEFIHWVKWCDKNFRIEERYNKLVAHKK